MKKVAFNFAAGETRTATVEVEGVEAFEITFKVPGAAAMASMALAAGAGGADAESFAARGAAVVAFVARQLTGWTLGEKCELRSVEALSDGEVLFAVYEAIAAAGRERKNS